MPAGKPPRRALILRPVYACAFYLLLLVAAFGNAPDSRTREERAEDSGVACSFSYNPGTLSRPVTRVPRRLVKN